jgi:D-3-phosphoglycerate dehydrogenase
MKALIIDHVSAKVPKGLEKLGFEVDFKILPTKQQLIEIIGGYEVLVMRVDPIIDRDILAAAKKLKMLCSCSAGMNHIDTEYAKQAGIVVVNAPGMNYNAVAELTLGKMLDLSRQSMAANHEVKIDKIWNKYKWMGRELRGKTVGIVGYGKIGRRVGHLAQAFDMTTIAYDPWVSSEQGAELGTEMLEMDELLRRADYVTIHVPLTPETRDLISYPQFEYMREGAMVINMSRGGIVNEKAMYDALKSGRLGGYGTDVMEDELSTGGLTDDAGFDSPLFELDGFIVSPHSGGSTQEAIDAIGENILEKVAQNFGLNI